MTENLSKELQEQLEGMQTFKSYQNKVNSVLQEVNQLQKEITELEAACKKEDKDVEDLEKGGLQAFYLKIRGKYEATMDKEILEAAAAKAKLNNKQFELEDVKRRLEVLQAEQGKYRACESLYKKLYQRRLDELLGEEGEAKITILQYQTKISELQHNAKELREAIRAGKRVVSELNRAAGSLDDARDYGTWDILGGGIVSDMMKHSRLDDAKGSLDHVQSLMREFKTELADVNMTLDIQIDTDGFAKFADFFFDGLFADISMQNRIRSSQESVAASRRKVESAVNRLEAQLVKESNAVSTYESKIVDLVNTTK